MTASIEGLAYAVKRQFIAASKSAAPVDGGSPAVDVALSIVDKLDTVDLADVPPQHARALRRCRAVAAAMPALLHTDFDLDDLDLLAEAGAIAAGEVLRLAGEPAEAVA